MDILLDPIVKCNFSEDQQLDFVLSEHIQLIPIQSIEKNKDGQFQT